jgi:hypothetical protein
MGLEGMFRKLIEPAEPDPEEVERARKEMDAFLKRDFEALSPKEQEKMLEAERAELRSSIESFRADANDSEKRIDEIAKARAEDGSTIEEERVKLQHEIRGLREEADDYESRFEELARGRAELTLNEKLRGVK